MRLELELEGEDVQFLSVNIPDGVATQGEMVTKCSYPLFQDLAEVDVWGLMNGGKDDFYIYDAGGNLARHYVWGEEPQLNLSTDEGYAILKSAIQDVVAGVAVRDLQAAEADVVTEETFDDAETNEPGPEPDANPPDAPGEEASEEPGPEAG